jgi:hypothetical protein
MPLIRHLYLSPGHNYFGHHGQAAGTHEIEERYAIELVAGSGIREDRFFDFKPDYKGQITFFDQAIVDAVRKHADNPSLPSSAFRRNVILEGVDLNSLIGKTFRLGEVLLQGTEECRPCYWMDEACGKPGTEDLLKGHGGLRCRILEGGWLRKGEVEVVLAE